MFGREDTIIAYASLKAAVTILTIQYANAFRRSGIHAHIKINAATPWVIAADLNNQPGNRIVEHGSQIIVQLRYFASRHPQANKPRQPGQVSGCKSWIGMWKP
jgi:NAD(P)-dependent dehydrogenase (short-subunit alcohol dehydrogenase family)